MAWFFYLTFGAITCTVRMEVRERFQIHGSSFEDLFVALILYPNCALQMELTTRILEDDLKSGKLRDAGNPTVETVGAKANGSDNPAFHIGIEQ